MEIVIADYFSLNCLQLDRWTLDAKSNVNLGFVQILCGNCKKLCAIETELLSFVRVSLFFFTTV